MFQASRNVGASVAESVDLLSVVRRRELQGMC